MERSVAALKRTVLVICVLGILHLASGCGAVEHRVDFKGGYQAKPGTGVQIGPIINETGQEIDFDYQGLFREALEKQLKGKNLFWTQDKKSKLILAIRIIEYEKGSAFQRWLLPGWGSTILEVEGSFLEGIEEVATCKALRTVDIGGGYTIGAWKSVFKKVAGDLAKDLSKKIPSH